MLRMLEDKQRPPEQAPAAGAVNRHRAAQTFALR